MEQNLKKIEELLSPRFQKIEVESDVFQAAFLYKGLLSRLVFLVKKIDAPEMSYGQVKQIVNFGKRWCTLNLKTFYPFRQGGLSIILLHEGQIKEEYLENQTDKTAMHESICQSLTAIDLVNHNILQKKVWIVVGKVKKALKKLRNFWIN